MENTQFNQFVSNLIDKKGLQNVSQEERDQMAEEISKLLTTEINRAVLSAITDEQLDELDRLADNPDFSEEDAREYINNTGVDVAKITAETMLRFEALYLGE